jgi:hypothetical protein
LILSDIAEGNLAQGISGESSRINLIIEDFASRDFTNYVLNSNLKICLVLTEFMSLGWNKEIVLNKFGAKSSRVVLIFEDTAIMILRYLKIFLPRRLKTKSEKLIYWKNREVGLRKILKYSNLEGIFCLHPDIELQAKSLIKGFPKDKIYTIFPRLNNIKSKEENLNPSIVSFGSKNRYRKKEIKKFNEVFPLKVFQPSFEKGLNAQHLPPSDIFLDLYFKNSKNWKYLSPVRIWRTIRQGSFIVYFGEQAGDHPINRCAIQIDLYENFAAGIENFSQVTRKIRLETESYDQVAKMSNDKAFTFLINMNKSVEVTDV